jgi:ferredoxin
MIKVNKKKCIGCGLCSQICSEVFEMNEEGKASVKKNMNKDANMNITLLNSNWSKINKIIGIYIIANLIKCY